MERTNDRTIFFLITRVIEKFTSILFFFLHAALERGKEMALERARALERERESVGERKRWRCKESEGVGERKRGRWR